MRKAGGPLSATWDELRPNMIAGFIWYLLGLVSWSGITSTFKYLTAHFGFISAALIDVAAIVIIFAGYAVIVRDRAATPTEVGPLSVVQVHHDPSTNPEITYKNKVRIAMRNESEKAIDIQAYWIANGNVSLQLPPRLVFRVEYERGGWRKDIWIPTEKAQIQIPPGWTVSTWFGLGDNLNSAAFGRARENHEFGTLAVQIEGQSEEVKIPI
jgi:hypothetical protein